MQEMNQNAGDECRNCKVQENQKYAGNMQKTRNAETKKYAEIESAETRKMQKTRKCRNQKLKNNCRNSKVQKLKLQKLNKNRMQKF
jgi:hypothetical protein